MNRLFKHQTIFIASSFIVLISIVLLAYPSGQSGCMLKTGNSGCNCHTSSTTSSVVVVISGPTTLQPGSTGNYIVTISGGSGTKVGVDIASSSGALTFADNNLKISNDELVHTSTKAFSGGNYVFKFNYTAPVTTGPITLYATACSSKPQWNFAQNFSVSVSQASDVNENISIPTEMHLYQNYPNPFNPTTKIKFSLRDHGNVNLSVYDISGKLVDKIISNQTYSAGSYEIDYNAKKLSSGIYFYSLISSGKQLTKKFIVIK